MDFRTFLADHIVLLDGATGTQLQKCGLKPGESPVLWNLTHPEEVTAVHRAYFDAGSNLVCANTFGADTLHFSPEETEQLICAAIRNAKKAAAESTGRQEKFVAMDLSSLGRLLKPLGDLDFEEAVSVFAYSAKTGARAGADAVIIETMTDSYETRAALLAVKESCDLPVIVSNVYDSTGRMMSGSSPLCMVAMLEGMGADAIGVNCSLGPGQLEPVVEEYLKYASVPVLMKPNAGMPRVNENGETSFDITREEFASVMERAVRKGVRLFGGCCGTTPEYIRALAKIRPKPSPILPKKQTAICSGRIAVLIGEKPLLIGERINPTGKKRLKQALLDNDLPYVLEEAVKQERCGAHALDINCGIGGIDEAALLPRLISEVQNVTDLPLQIDTADPVAMEKALRLYHGKPLINSVNGKRESLRTVLPLAKKYGGVLIALTLDESGIPPTAEGRVAIAHRILDEASKYGIQSHDILFDPLTLTVSTDHNAAAETLRAVKLLREMGCLVSLGVSNVSFGLPNRDALNGVFFAMALQCGLNAAIMNPCNSIMMNAYHAFRLLNGQDAGAAGYIAFAASQAADAPAPTAPVQSCPPDGLAGCILHGLKESAAKETKKLLETTPALELIEQELIPALNRAGEGYETHRLYLPQLLMSAEAARAAFEVIRAETPAASSAERFTVVLATVKGDIHDIGKNIVRMLLENYGFRVIDLGKDVSPETVVDAVRENRAALCGLSALMTTTLPAMKETVALLKKETPWVKIAVGGAVLTPEYAAAIGADCCAGDAMSTVRFAESLE